MWRYGLSLLIGLAATAANSTDASHEFGATRFTFAPTLIESSNPELCNQILDAAHKVFRSSTAAPNLTIEQLPLVTWIDWKDAQRLETSRGTVYRIDIDLDGTGTSQSILYRVHTHSWRGDWHYAYVVSESSRLDELIRGDEDLSRLLPHPDQQYEPAVGSDSLRQFYPTATLADGVSQVGGNVWNGLRLFRWQDRIYLLDESRPPESLPPVPITIYRVQADAKLERVCALDIPSRKDEVASALRSSGLSTLLRQLHWISGNGGGFCGTLNADARHFGEAMAASRNTAVRPWAVSRHDPSFDWYGVYHVYDERLRAFLKDWSLGSAWNRVVFLELQQHIPFAVENYAQFLQRNFGLSSQIAAARAQTVVENLIAAWIQVPNGYDPPADLYTLEQTQITLALLARDSAALKDALSKTDEIHSEARIWPKRSPPVSVISWHMHDAVIWHDGLQALLRAGAEVDARNAFGKTPLMTAAHFNRPDAIRTLLRSKADVNARTDESFSDCGYQINRGERTALMYAAENAGLEVIRLLLDAGADTTDKDSQGNGLEFYLARNPRFSGVLNFESVVRLAAQPASEDAPSFSCLGQLSDIEAAICKDETLRLLDRDIAEAYSQLLRRTDSIRAEQRAWLAERKSCREFGGEAMTGCLQDLLYARLRYLNARIADAPPAPIVTN